MIRDLTYESELINTRTKEYNILDVEQEFLVDKLIEDITDTLNSLDRPYLCANEIGYNARVFGIKFDEEIKMFFNPVVVKRGKGSFTRERCNLDNKDYINLRCHELTIQYTNSDVKAQQSLVKGETAVVFQEAIDCLNGIHPSTVGLEITPEFDEASEEEREEVLKAYGEELKKFYNNLDNELSADEETSKYWTSYKYNYAKHNGDIEVEYDTPTLNRKQRRLIDKLNRKLGGKKK